MLTDVSSPIPMLSIRNFTVWTQGNIQRSGENILWKKKVSAFDTWLAQWRHCVNTNQQQHEHEMNIHFHCLEEIIFAVLLVSDSIVGPYHWATSLHYHWLMTLVALSTRNVYLIGICKCWIRWWAAVHVAYIGLMDIYKQSTVLLAVI